MNISSEAMLLIVIAVILGVGGIYNTWRYLSQLEKRLQSLEATEALRFQTLKDARGRERAHHAYNTIQAIEDATAVLLEASLDIEATKARQETALGILNVLRQGPNAYNGEGPSSPPSS